MTIFKTQTLDLPEWGEVILLEIDLKEIGGVITPDALETLEIPAVCLGKAIIVSGPQPIWLAAFVAHLCHVSRWLAYFDPRLAGAVVVSTHSPVAPKIGSIVKLPD